MRQWIDLIENQQAEDAFGWLRKLPKPPRDLKAPRPEDLELINRVRETIRHHEGMGGMCHEVSEWIENYYGWERDSGTYLSQEGEPVCVFHFWNYLPDGSILDSTPDQHGEDDREIRIIHPSDPEYTRYTCEWCEDWHPGHPDYDPTWKRERRDPAKYSGMIDYDRENDLRAKHGGDRWWYVGDRSHVERYKTKARGYGEVFEDA